MTFPWSPRASTCRQAPVTHDSQLGEQVGGRPAGNRGRAAKTLVKEGPLSVTLAGVRAGVQLEEHSAAGPVVVQGLRGIARVTASGNEVEVGPGTLVALDQRVSHAVQAIEDCVLPIIVTTAQEAK